MAAFLTVSIAHSVLAFGLFFKLSGANYQTSIICRMTAQVDLEDELKVQ